MASEARVVVAVDFGTTFSGFAYARRSEPNNIFKYYEWPCASRAGAKPYCKTQTSLFYAPASHDGLFELRGWGWSGFVQFMQANRPASRTHAAKIHHPYALATPDSLPLLLYGASSNDQRSPPFMSTQKVRFFATKFKLYLAPNADILSHNLPDDITVERMVVDYLRCLSDFIIMELQVAHGKHFGKKDVQWCLTVPAIWDEKAKQVMKVCAEKAGMVKGVKCPEGVAASPYPIDIILEPEAASIYCQQKAKHLKLKQGAKLLVADVGGGTIDLVVHEKADEDPMSMRVHEAVSSYGDIGGGTFVDANFFRFLSQKIECFKEFCKNNTSDILKIYDWWQGIKAGFDGEGYSAEMALPRKLSEAWEKYDKDLGIVCDDKDQYAELILEDCDIISIFDPEVEKVLNLIEKQIEGVYVLMLVGGFSASPYLRKRVQSRFESRVAEVIIPDDPGSAICYGAVQLHISKDIIQSRVAKRTYGIGMARYAMLDDPPGYLFINDDGNIMCNYCFDLFMQVGKRVPLNGSIKKTYLPLQHGQHAITFSLYSTTNSSVKYTTETSVVKEGTFIVDISEGMSLGKARSVEVKMVFGASLIQVSATRLNFGNPHSERGLSVTFHNSPPAKLGDASCSQLAAFGHVMENSK